MKLDQITEAWSDKYKRSINCNNPKGFSQKAHCAGRKKNESLNEDVPPMSELVAMATVASVSVPVIKAMFKAAYKTGKGILSLKRIADAAGVKLADNLLGEAEEEQLQKPAPLAIDFELIKRKFSELESRGIITPEEADQFRRATQSLATNRKTIYPEAILQFITVLLQK